MAEATIERLTVKHGPFSSTQGTQDVISNAIQQAEGGKDKSAAAAPTLLDALKMAEATIERLTVKHGPFSSTQGTQDVISNAIQQAERDKDKSAAAEPKRKHKIGYGQEDLNEREDTASGKTVYNFQRGTGKTMEPAQYAKPLRSHGADPDVDKQRRKKEIESALTPTGFSTTIKNIQKAGLRAAVEHLVEHAKRQGMTEGAIKVLYRDVVDHDISGALLPNDATEEFIFQAQGLNRVLAAAKSEAERRGYTGDTRNRLLQAAVQGILDDMNYAEHGGGSNVHLSKEEQAARR